MVDDPRYRTKLFLEAYLTAGNLTKDDDATLISFIVAFGEPDYPITKVFLTKGVDLVFSIGDPTSTAEIGHDQTPHHYNELVPITVTAINKTGITGEKLRQKAINELRRIAEENPTGSQRAMQEERSVERRLGSTILYQQVFMLNYRRDTT